MLRFMNYLIRNAHYQAWKAKLLKTLGERKPKGLNRIANKLPKVTYAWAI